MRPFSKSPSATYDARMNQKRTIKRALISVYDKSGLLEFARALVDEFGIEIISTGGTAKHLKEGGLPVTLVEDITGFPEMLDGRVKTLHPKIHAAILADRDNPEHMRQLEEQGIKPIDMVVVNLYPFEKTVADPNCTFEQAIEMIDIGGPCLLRAAAKNNRHVMAVVSSDYYESALSNLREPTAEFKIDHYRLELAEQVFDKTRWYDADIMQWLQRFRGDVQFGWINILDWGPVRYGENPHQTASLNSCLPKESPFDLASCDKGGGKDWQAESSFNNYVDADAALRLCFDVSIELEKLHKQPVSRRLSDERPRLPAVCLFVKHTNPCGVCFSKTISEAYKGAYLGDPNAAMGGILACNNPVSAEFARLVMNTFSELGKSAGASGFFLELWVAPLFQDDAIEVIQNTKDWGKRTRLFETGWTDEPLPEDEVEYKSISGGILCQQKDNIGLNEDQWKVVTKRKPTESEISDLRLAWLIAKHTKSNAISICKDGMLIGNGAGQMSRVMSCRIATWLAKENRHEDKLKGSVAASDAFFPFPDGPNILIDAGVTAIIQPGGSKNDDKVIAACDERGVAMIFTGTRHFKH